MGDYTKSQFFLKELNINSHDLVLATSLSGSDLKTGHMRNKVSGKLISPGWRNTRHLVFWLCS